MTRSSPRSPMPTVTPPLLRRPAAPNGPDLRLPAPGEGLPGAPRVSPAERAPPAAQASAPPPHQPGMSAPWYTLEYPISF